MTDQEIYNETKKLVEELIKENNFEWTFNDWIKMYNPYLGGVTPQFLFQKGRGDKVLMMVRSIRSGY